jgi:hypothetical protein
MLDTLLLTKNGAHSRISSPRAVKQEKGFAGKSLKKVRISLSERTKKPREIEN